MEQEAEASIALDAGSTVEVDQESRRFACDSNPIATLMEQTESRLQKGKSQRGDVGAWLDAEENSVDQGEAHRSSLESILGTHVHPDWLPSKECQEVLIGIYFRRVHPLLPLLDEGKVRIQHEVGSLSPRLVQAICLVAAKDRSAVPFLCLGPHSNPLPLEKFSSILYNDAMQNIPRRAEKRYLKYNSLNLTQAIHYSHTMGLHLLRPDQHSGTCSKAIFWCLWSLDRWNAAMNGRPLMIHDGDRSQGVDDVISTFQSPFRVWLRISDKLGEVINLYRPIMKVMDQSEVNLTSFEDILEQCEAWDMSPDLLESLELAYHSVILLSTHSSGLQGRSRPLASKIRQSHSIHTIASLSCNQDIRDSLPFPMIGYTISLAFSVTYKQLRESKLPSARHTAISQIRLFHQCLKNMCTTWWSAAVMTRLGQRLLSNIQATIDKECFTGPDTNITRPNSPPDPNHIFSQPLISTDDMPSESAVNIAQVARRIHTGSQTTHPPAEHRLESDKPSNAEVDTMPFLSATEVQDFDTFFGNFLDVGFPNRSNDQLLLDLDMADFEYGDGLA
ncbi:Transcription factor [Penicillium coprophilum]|uniref:Transcription factor n=1 Tax=Penicillium coprophilum TaxID=36646 RepID=UPI0023933129|nr:Transcription factor [Penicillium coprophilum]KAJ5153768.1 Transcription factor [Penicillium coprophilum]